ncbi:MAG: hypothetical protein HeimC2_35370 [Candidatus Heimdallarchaeota archaeon LC_2]|nr:MAG: hypothetical protein HeimC2_35370 [Candidatus Heimdallarchaeota archaeon LC_2]
MDYLQNPLAVVLIESSLSEVNKSSKKISISNVKNRIGYFILKEIEISLTSSKFKFGYSTEKLKLTSRELDEIISTFKMLTSSEYFENFLTWISEILYGSSIGMRRRFGFTISETSTKAYVENCSMDQLTTDNITISSIKGETNDSNILSSNLMNIGYGLEIRGKNLGAENVYFAPISNKALDSFLSSIYFNNTMPNKVHKRIIDLIFGSHNPVKNKRIVLSSINEGTAKNFTLDVRDIITNFKMLIILVGFISELLNLKIIDESILLTKNAIMTSSQKFSMEIAYISIDLFNLPKSIKKYHIDNPNGLISVWIAIKGR